MVSSREESQRKSESTPEYEQQKDSCVKDFDKWSEQEQVDFVEHLLSRMCHYQHGQINTYLKPMLQRDFITALPGQCCVCIYIHVLLRVTFKCIFITLY